MLHALTIVLLSLSIGSIIYSILISLLPFISGFISAEWAKGIAWVQSIGGVFSPIIGLVVGFVVTAAFSFLVSHFPGTAPFIPADYHNLTTDAVAGILTAILNAIFHITPVAKKLRLARGLKA